MDSSREDELSSTNAAYLLENAGPSQVSSCYG